MDFRKYLSEAALESIAERLNENGITVNPYRTLLAPGYHKNNKSHKLLNLSLKDI